MIPITVLATALSPSRLVRPEDLAPSAEPLVSQPTLAWIAAAVVLIAAAMLVVSRRRRLEPSERAFRVLSRRMNLRPSQARSIRRRARDTGVAPVALLVCPRSARAHEDASRRLVGSGIAGRVGDQTPRLIAS